MCIYKTEVTTKEFFEHDKLICSQQFVFYEK